MDVNLLKSQETFALHLDGDNSIEANTLAELIKDIAELTKIAANRQNPDSYLKMNVTAFENGSFQIDFSAVVEFAQNLLNDPSQLIGFAAQTISTVKGFFEIKKLLSGKSEKNIKENQNGTVTVTATDGSSVTVNKNSISILENAHIDNLVVNINNNVYNHNNKGGFSFNTSEGESYYSANDVNKMQQAFPIADEEIIRRSVITADLVISKADLLRHSAWTFLYEGKSINASIRDQQFLDDMHNRRMSIHSGDYISADLEITVRLDEHGQPVNDSTRYAVLKVYDGIKNDIEKQMSILI